MMKVVKKQPSKIKSNLKKRIIFRVNKEIPISNVGQIAGNIAIENEILNYSIQFGMSGAYTDKDGVEHKSDIDEGKCTIILQEI